MNSNEQDKSWIELKFHDNDKQQIIKPNQIKLNKNSYPKLINDTNILNSIQGSIMGMAIGDALGAHVEFRPRDYLKANPVKELQAGGTWGLEKGQFTDDTSMALCLALSLIAHQDFIPYDQLMRYKWWYRHGYMSSTGHCFDIGAATRQSIQKFEIRQRKFAQNFDIPLDEMNYSSNPDLFQQFDVYCSTDGVAGNGALMRLAPVPLFFYRDPIKAIEYSGISGRITHGDDKAYDACRYYGALIVAVLQGMKKEELLEDTFYEKHKTWFDNKDLHIDIRNIAMGSFKKHGGYDQGIRGKGYIVNALEAALWAFWNDENSFEKGVLDAINLGDDTDTTAAIYGQLAGAYYGYNHLPEKWSQQIYAKDFLLCISQWITYDGQIWFEKQITSSSSSSSSSSLLINSNPIINNNNTFSIENNSNNIIYRKAINYHDHIGSLYDIYTDSIIDLSSNHFQIKQNENYLENICIIKKGDQIKGENLLKLIGLDDQLRLNILSDIIIPTGIASVINYPYSIDEFTRIIYYSYNIRYEISSFDNNQIELDIEQSYTHIINGIDKGIDIIIILRLSSIQSNIIDNILDYIKKSLINNIQIKENILIDDNQIVSINIYSNIDHLNNLKTLNDIYQSIYKIKNNLQNYKSTNYILQPIKIFNYHIFKLSNIEKIEQYLFQFLLIQKLWLTINKQDKSNLIKQYFQEQKNHIDNQLIILNQNYLNEKNNLKEIILNIRQKNYSENIIDHYFNENSKLILKDNINQMIYSIINFKEKLIFINNIIQRNFIYENANKYFIQQNDNQYIIEQKLIKNNLNTIFLCSNDYLNNNNIIKIDQLSFKLSNENNFKLIYLDFTYSSYQLNQITIYPLKNQIHNQIESTSLLLLNKKQNINFNSIIDEKNINILLLGKSQVGKSTLINNFINYFKSNYQTRISIPNFIISFAQIFVNDNGEHIIHIGNHDPNENYDYPDQSITQQCKLYNFNLNNNKNKNLCFIDTPGFGKTINNDIIMQHILSKIINLNHLNAISIIIDSNETLFDDYQTCLTNLFHFFGNDIAKNIIFSFTKTLSTNININQRNSSIKLMIEKLNIPNIHFNEQTIFDFDSTFFINSNISDCFTSLDDSSLIISEESWKISERGWNRLINYIQLNISPFLIQQNLEKIKSSQIEIKQLIRPLLETLRNNLRNIILFKMGYQNCSIEIHPIELLYPSTICYSCKRNYEKFGEFWITLDSPHKYRNICDYCSCTSDKHIQIDYQLKYKYFNNKSIQNLIPLEDLLCMTTYLSYFLLQEHKEDLFLVYLNKIIDEEKFIYQNYSFHGLNLTLYNQLVNFKYNYQQQIDLIKQKGLSNHFDIYDLIETIKQIPDIKIQLDVATKIQQISI